MREVLIRYLLGELSPEEHDEVHARLQNSPELRQELARLRECFAAHQSDEFDDEGVPGDLASRTAERIASGELTREQVPARRGERLSAAGDAPAGFLGWSLADLTVAGGVMIAVSMLIFPALRNSRFESRRVQCQNNLNQLYVVGTLYSDNNHDFLPQVGEKQPAGIFVFQFIAKHYIDEKSLAALLMCPDSPQAEKIRNGAVFELPSAEKISRMTPAQIVSLAAIASPCYAYVLPHRSAHKYCYVKNDRHRLSPVFSDASSDDGSGSFTPNHEGRISQVQFADGHSSWFKSWKLAGVDDDMSRNDLGLVRAGRQPRDIVLGNCWAMPGEETGE